jgi:hypothetical protein
LSRAFGQEPGVLFSKRRTELESIQGCTVSNRTSSFHPGHKRFKYADYQVLITAKLELGSFIYKMKFSI